MKAVNGCLVSLSILALAVIVWLLVAGCITGSVSYEDPESHTRATIHFTPKGTK